MKSGKRNRILSLVLANIMIIAGCDAGNGNVELSEDPAIWSVSGGEVLPDNVTEDTHEAKAPAKQEGVSKNEPIEEMYPQPVFKDDKSGISYAYRVDGDYLAVYDGREFKPVYLNGVNIGSGVPGYFPGELGITYDEYRRWFDEIAAMNCNCIRIYTTMMPQFYEALYDYNAVSQDKLYLLMGVWYDEDKIIETGDAYDVIDYAVSEAKEQIDIIHGDCVIPQRAGRAYGTYTVDVADYVLGWILGIESDAYFVGTTNDLYKDITSYEGEYLSVENADAFHAFLARLGDETIAYESEKYGMQRPVSWSNWPTADEMTHPEEPLFEMEDAVTINVERIKPTQKFAPGVFASYHVYPYYPDFMMLADKYTHYKDESGRINTYKAYLKDLKSIHKVPVMVAEFGVPTSRGCTHQNPFSHYDQGHLTEKEQGEALSSMAQDIYDCGYCGGLIFAWQDEWFKRTWNTMDYTDPDRRAYWSDIQTSEQNFGILCFDPGEEKMDTLIDGKFDDWADEEVFAETDGLKLYVKKDERYMYLCIKGMKALPKSDMQKDRIVIPFDITPLSGHSSYKEKEFDRDADFVLCLNGKDDSTLLVHRYYDRYAFAFGEYDNLLDSKGYDDPDSAEFIPIYLCMNRTQWIPTTEEWRDAERMDSGLLRYGNADPSAQDYDSLADMCYGDDFIELRLAWGLLNFRDPSSKEVEGDFWGQKELYGINVDEIYIGIMSAGRYSGMSPYTWDNWDMPTYHERLKQSYYILKDKYDELKLD